VRGGIKGLDQRDMRHRDQSSSDGYSCSHSNSFSCCCWSLIRTRPSARRQSTGFVQNNFEKDDETRARLQHPRAAHGECLDKKGKKKMADAPSPPDASELERLAAFLRLIPEDGPLARLLKGAALLETPLTTPAELASDILHGADQIAHFLYGDKKHRRRVYRLVETGKLPHFKLGASVCSRKSVLLKWIRNQEGIAPVHHLPS